MNQGYLSNARPVRFTSSPLLGGKNEEDLDLDTCILLPSQRSCVLPVDQCTISDLAYFAVTDRR